MNPTPPPAPLEPWIQAQLDAAARLFADLRADARLGADLAAIAAAVVDGFARGARLLTLGNGGSAADAQHLAEELIGRYRGDRRPLPAICLTADGAALTCIGNDYGFEQIFARQVQALARPGDLVLVFSTSGHSANVLAALEAARAAGAITLGLLGRDGGPAAALCDLSLIVPHADTARIQEAHGLALHVICEAVERALAGA